jgi:hypothetical protein
MASITGPTLSGVRVESDIIVVYCPPLILLDAFSILKIAQYYDDKIHIFETAVGNHAVLL